MQKILARGVEVSLGMDVDGKKIQAAATHGMPVGRDLGLVEGGDRRVSWRTAAGAQNHHGLRGGAFRLRVASVAQGTGREFAGGGSVVFAASGRRQGEDRSAGRVDAGARADHARGPVRSGPRVRGGGRAAGRSEKKQYDENTLAPLCGEERISPEERSKHTADDPEGALVFEKT